MIKEMAATKRNSSPPRPAAGYRDAFDALVGRIQPGQIRDCALAASKTLQKSSSYKRIVDRLNLAYVSAERIGGVGKFEPDDDGKLTTGPFAGRHTLVFVGPNEGNRFLRAGAFQTQTTGFPQSDWIALMFPSGIDSPAKRGEGIAQLVASIAHETVHASHRVKGGTAPAPSLTRAERADAFIKEELDTRKEEEAILKELLSLKVGTKRVLETLEKETKSEGLREELENHVGAMKLSRHEVERDFVSGTKLTYLETFVIEDLIEQSIRVEKLDSLAVQESRTLVNELVLVAPVDRMLKSEHPEFLTQDKETEFLTTHLPTQVAELFLIRRLVEQHWNESAAADRERILQGHRDDVFPDEIVYTALP